MMPKKQKPWGYYTFERCEAIAKPIKTRGKFKEKFPSAYKKARENKWLDKICSHMTSRNKWTKESLRAEAKKFKTKSEFKRKEYSGYNTAVKNNWLNEICSHMPVTRLTFELCKEAAEKCNTRTEFSKIYGGAYGKAKRNNWLDKICAHMKIQGGLKERAIYEIFDESRKMSYIGLSFNPEKRYKRHKKEQKGCKKLLKGPHQIRILTSFMPADEAAIEEKKFIKKRKKEGWNVLNRAKGGSLGGNTLKWPRELVEKEAEKYSSKMDFLEGSSGAYHRALKEGYLEDICNHMDEGRNPNGFWTKSRIMKESKKYDNRTEFSKNSSAAATIAKRHGWMDDVCGHMKVFKKPKGYWTLDRVKEARKPYSSKSEFRKKNNKAYTAAQKNGWLEKI